MRRLPALAILPLLLSGLGVSSVSAVTPEKSPWQWSNAERIAARTNRNLAAERLMAARGATTEAQSIRTSAATHLDRTIDIIVGKEHPELFLPTELFETLVRDGLVSGDLWREFYRKQLSMAGLPADFWPRLETISRPYVDDLRRSQQLLGGTSDSPVEKTAIENEVAGMSSTLCRERYDALVNARLEFGVALDRLMYTYVAGKTTMFTDELSDPSLLKAEGRGCR